MRRRARGGELGRARQPRWGRSRQRYRNRVEATSGELGGRLVEAGSAELGGQLEEPVRSSWSSGAVVVEEALRGGELGCGSRSSSPEALRGGELEESGSRGGCRWKPHLFCKASSTGDPGVGPRCFLLGGNIAAWAAQKKKPCLAEVLRRLSWVTFGVGWDRDTDKDTHTDTDIDTDTDTHTTSHTNTDI